MTDSQPATDHQVSAATALDEHPIVIAAVESTQITLEANPRLAVYGARGSHTRSNFTIIRIIAEDGLTGHGEVSATLGWSGEDGTTADHIIRTIFRPLLVGQRLVSVAALSAQIDKAVASNPFTKAGVNMALWDLLGKATGRRVVELLGGPFREKVPVKMSLSGDGEAFERCYQAVREHGFTSFKVKVGVEVERDVARFALARKLAGEATFLGADANCGWSRLEAGWAIPRLAKLGAAFIEQPVAAADVDGLAALRGRGLPVLADESVFSLGDVARVIRADAADAVSVYVGKIGGLESAVLAVRMLALFGIDALIGSNGEMGLGAAAQLHVACASQALSPIPSDIIGHHYYDRDTLVSPLDIDGVHAHLPSSPGLGVEPNPEIVRDFA